METNNIPRISDAEWIVMRILWKSSPLTANQIVEMLSPNTSWNPRTIKTLINRLVKKEAAGAIRKTREFKFFPIVDEKNYVKKASRDFLKRFYGSSMSAMLADYLEHEEATAQEISKFNELLKQ
jgi:BlaI family transcriptional regulator, penicillinase repressor